MTVSDLERSLRTMVIRRAMVLAAGARLKAELSTFSAFRRRVARSVTTPKAAAEALAFELWPSCWSVALSDRPLGVKQGQVQFERALADVFASRNTYQIA